MDFPCFHDLRHTFNTNLNEGYRPAERLVIMKLTGHKTVAMSLRYNNVEKDDEKDAMEKLDRFLEHENCSYRLSRENQENKIGAWIVSSQ